MQLDCPSITRFKGLVELKDFKPATKKEYVRYVRRLSEHFHCDPAALSEDQLRHYFLFLRQEKKFSGSAMSIARAALQLFFREHLGRADWKVFSELAIRRGQPLPLVLSREEVRRTLDCLREERFGTCLRLIYQCGLRVGEAVKIKVTDIDAAQLRLRIVQGKGGKDRYVPLTLRVVEELRAFWKTHRNPVWLFPAVAVPFSAPGRLCGAGNFTALADGWETGVDFRVREVERASPPAKSKTQRGRAGRKQTSATFHGLVQQRIASTLRPRVTFPIPIAASLRGLRSMLCLEVRRHSHAGFCFPSTFLRMNE